MNSHSSNRRAEKVTQINFKNMKNKIVSKYRDYDDRKNRDGGNFTFYQMNSKEVIILVDVLNNMIRYEMFCPH